MSKLGLVLEGGGMRGIYTAGVLDFFMEQNLYPTVSLASAQVPVMRAAMYPNRSAERTVPIPPI